MTFADLPRPLMILAPMDDVTDTVFRRVVGSCAAPDLYFTEFVNVDGLQSIGRPRLLKKMRFTEAETPLVAHIWGKAPENFYKTAQQIADGTYAREFGLPEHVNFVGIDLNMGCPDKTVVKNGCCSALIDNRELAKDIIAATKAGAGNMQVSVKTRLGTNKIDLTWHDFLLDQKLNMLTIHGRTRKEMSAVPAHWDVIGQIRELRDSKTLNTLIIGNGDVLSRQQGLELAEQYKLDGIMIGRGIFQDPFAFAEHSPWPERTAAERIALYRKHVELFAETWQDGERRVPTLNKFCKVYIQNFDGAKELREQLMAAESTDELVKILAAVPA